MQGVPLPSAVSSRPYTSSSLFLVATLAGSKIVPSKSASPWGVGECVTVSKKLSAPLPFRSCQAWAGAPQTSFFFVSRPPIRVCSGELRGRLETGGGSRGFLSACCSTRGVLPTGGGAFRSAGGSLSVPFSAPDPASWCSLRCQLLWPQRASSELGRSPLLSSKFKEQERVPLFL